MLLIPLPVVGVPLEQIGLDLVRPLESSASSHQYTFMIIDYMTRYHKKSHYTLLAPKLATGLIKVFAWIEILYKILMDQGTNVISRLMADFSHLLGIRALRTSL